MVAIANKTKLRLAVEYAVGVESLQSGEARVDRAQGVIRGVKVVGLQSRNPARVLGFLPDQWGEAADRPYGYSIEALRGAVEYYNNATVYSNHPQFQYDDRGVRTMPDMANRSNDDMVGWLENCHVVETGNPEIDGIYGEFHVVKSHTLAERVFEVAERNPSKFALSHEAFWNDPQLVGGQIVLNKIDNVFAVALVSVLPGTTNGLFESFAGVHPIMRKTFRQIAESHKATPSGRIAFEMLNDTAMEPMAETPVEVADSASAEQQVKAAFRAVILAYFDDDSLDTPATVAKIKEALKAYDTVSGEGGSDKGSDDSGAAAESDAGGQEEENKSAQEAAKHAGDNTKVAIECVGLLNGAGIPVTPMVIETMTKLPNLAARETYVRELGALRVTSTVPARSASPPPKAAAAESAAAPKPMTLDEMAAAFRG